MERGQWATEFQLLNGTSMETGQITQFQMTIDDRLAQHVRLSFQALDKMNTWTKPN